MKIRTSACVWGWYAYDDDTYDGAPDAGRLARMLGHGRTEQEAIDDLKEQIQAYHEELGDS